MRQVLGPSVSAEVTAALVDRAAGNAFYLEELIRAVAEGEPGALPETVLAVIEARLSSLDAPSRLALRAASVFGQAFWAGGVRALVSGEGRTTDIGARLRDLSQRELITRRPAGRFQGEEEYVFRHALVREAAYAMLTDADRALGHRLAGDWLERAGEHQAAVLAEHFERGGDAERAIGWYRRAAEQAQEANDLGAAIALADRALALGASGEVRGALRLVQAEAHMWRGDNEAARRSAEGALSDLPKESPRWIAAAGEAAVACSRLSDKGALVAIGAELHRLSSASAEGPVSSAEVTHAQVISAARVAIQLLFSGQTEMADALLANLERGAGAASERDPAALGWIHQARAWRALFEGDPAAYLSLSEAAAERFKAAGDERSVSNARMNMAYACFQMGDPEQAARALGETVAVMRRMGLSTAVAEHNLGLALALAGRIEEALSAERSAVEAFSKRTNRRLLGGGRLYLALILAMANRLPEAEEEARLAVEAAEAGTPVLAYALAVLASVRLARGSVEDARRDADEAARLLEALGGVDEGDAFIRLVHAEAQEAAGDAAGASALAAAAKARLQERAAKIKDAAWRESFLTRVPENARTLALAARLAENGAPHAGAG